MNLGRSSYLTELRLEFARSPMFTRVPEHEMIRQERAAILNVTLNYTRPWEGSERHVAVMQRKWGRYDTRFCAKPLSRRYWRAVGRVIWLEAKATWMETLHPERHRNLPRR